MKCKKCGVKLQRGDDVCPNCGQKRKRSIVFLILAILFFPISLTYLIVRTQKMNDIVKVVLIVVLWIFVGMVGRWENENPTDVSEKDFSSEENQTPEDTPTPTPLISLEWPKSELALVIPALEDAYGTVILNNEEEVCIRVDNVTKEEYMEYRNTCTGVGFTNVTLDGENWLQASNEAGYRLSLSYDSEYAYMSIDVKLPLLKVTLEIKCEENLIFNRYDLEILFAGESLGYVEHGKTETFDVEAEERGRYTLEIRSAKDQSVKKKISMDVTREDSYKYVVSCHGGEVRVTEVAKINAPVVPSELGNLTYDVVKQKFEDAGFTNVIVQEVKDLPLAERGKSTFVSDISVNGVSDYMIDESFFEDAAVIIIYRTPQKITMVRNDEDYHGMNYKEVKKELEELGFVNIEIKSETITSAYYANEQVYDVTISSIFGFKKGEECEYDSTIRIKYYIVNTPSPTPTPSPAYYSTNTYEEAKKGNTGVFSYKSKSGSYDVYWIINFDEGYVYWFTDGNGENFCDKVKIVSGTLNDRIAVTWHMDGEEWSWYLHFKYENSPATLIVNDHYGFETEFGTTDLDDALKIRDTKKIKEY